MSWTVRFEDEFEREFLALDVAVQDELLAGARLLRQYVRGSDGRTSIR